MKENQDWSIRGYDTLAEEFYPIGGSYRNQEKAEDAANKELIRLEKSQPTESSGGQGDDGIQDRMFIVRPDGTSYRFLPKT